MNAIYFSTMFLGGFLADKFDRKKLILFYWIVTTPTPLIYSLATNWKHLIPGSIMYNFALGDPAVSAYIATAAPKKRIVRAFAITQAGYSLGMVFSPLLGAYLLTVIDIGWLFRIAFMFYSVSTITMLLISPQVPEKKQRRSAASDFAAVVRERRLMAWILLFTLTTFATSISTPFISPLLEDLHSFQRSTILVMGSIISAGQATLAVFLGWFGDRYGVARALIVGFTLNVIGVILLGFSSFSLFLPLAVFLIGVRQVTASLSSSVVAKYSLINLQGTIFGVYSVLIGVGGICGPYLGGVLYESSPTRPFLWTSISLIISSFFVMIVNALFSKKDSIST